MLEMIDRRLFLTHLDRGFRAGASGMEFTVLGCRSQCKVSGSGLCLGM